MASIGTVVIEIEANTARLVQGVRQSQRQMSQLQRTVDRTREGISKFVKAAAGLYVVSKAFSGLTGAAASFVATSSKMEAYSNRMSAFTTTQVEANSEMQRASTFAKKWNLDIADTTETLLLLKNTGLDDSTESLKILTNTAIGSGKSLAQYAEAMADALTGENERLKEFGVKASVLGEKIGYVWTDSSGKTRNIIIKNNKDIINSTLNTIMNEKYIGLIEKRATSWAGLMQGMSNDWETFQTNVGKAGLFSYFKVLATNISKNMRAAFGDSKTAAKKFANASIALINGIIKSLASLVKGINYVISSFQLLYAAGQRAVGSAFGGDVDEVRAKIKALQDDLKDPTHDYGFFGSPVKTKAEIRMLKKKIKAYTEWNQVRKDGKDYQTEILAKEADFEKFIDALTKSIPDPKDMKDAVSQMDKLLKDKAKAVADLNKTGAGYGGLSDSKGADKAAIKAAKKLAKDLLKIKSDAKSKQDKIDKQTASDKDKADKKEMAKLKTFTEAISGGIDSAFSAVMSGDIQGGFRDLFSDMLSFGIEALVELGLKAAGVGVANQAQGDPYTAPARMAAMAAQMAILGFAVAGGGGSGGGSKPREIGKYNQESDTISGFSDSFENALNPLLSVTREMKTHLANIDRAFNGIEKSLTLSNVNFSGQGLSANDYEDDGIFSGRSSTFDSAGLSVGAGSLDDYILGNVDAWLITQIEKSKSSFFGLSSETWTVENSDLLSGADKEFVKYIGKAVNGSIDLMMTSALALGLDINPLENFSLEAFEIDTTGKTNEEIASEMESILGSQIDAASDIVFKDLSNYAERGENLADAAARITINNDQLSASFLGMNKVFGGWEDLAIFARASGGAGQGLSNISSYIENFYSEQEQLDISVASLTASFGELNQGLPDSKEALRALIDSTTDPKALAGLLSLTSAFSDMTDASQALADASKALADEERQRAEELVNVERQRIEGLRKSQAAYITQASITIDDINKAISRIKLGDTEEASGKIDKWASEQLKAATASANAATASANAAVSSYNAAASASNATRNTIISMRDGVYKSFRDLQNFTTKQSFDSLASAINNKNYSGISGAFSSHASSLSNTATSQEDFYLGIAKANALVQGVDAPKFIENMATSTASTAASTSTIARINAEAAEMYERLIKQNESLLPEESTYYTDTTLLANLAMEANNNRLDTNNNLLGELKSQNNTMIGLMNKANEAQNTSNDLAYEQKLQNNRNYTAPAVTRTQQIGGELG